VDQQGVLGQLENDLGSVGLLIAALLALVTFGVAAATVPVYIRELVAVRSATDGDRPGRGQSDEARKPPGTPAAVGQKRDGDDSVARFGSTPPAQDKSDWLHDLRRARRGTVTIWFGAGAKVNGTVADKDLATIGTKLAVRLDEVRFRPELTAAEEHAAYLLVPVDDIKMIAVEISVSPALSSPPVQSGPPEPPTTGS
jgi:hypothetical protein